MAYVEMLRRNMTVALKQVVAVDAALTEWRRKATDAAHPFESRWTWGALKRFNPDLAQALHEQRAWFDEACITGSAKDIATQGAALCRGYRAAVDALQANEIPDDSYRLGQCAVTGYRVAIGDAKQGAHRVREVYGQDVVWMTPDEVAGLMGSLESLKAIGAVKQIFPGAEIIQKYTEAGS